MKKILPLLLLTPTLANAECIPSPDCADMGYTETSCSGSFVRCPFDISKLFCTPCDSSYQYDCAGNNVTGGIGSSCQNKYASCECVSGAIFTNGNCVCDTSCTIGNIYYSDKTCSSCLEISKTPIGVVVKDNELILSVTNIIMSWSSDYINIPEIPNYSSASEARLDYGGKSNTLAIVNTYGSGASNVAGVYCYNYTPNGMENTKGQWYLLSAGELYDYVYQNSGILLDTYRNKLGTSSFNFYFWSSSEANSNYAWHIWTTTGSLEYAKTKTYSYYVSCALSIK